MRTLMISVLTAGTLLTAALPAAAQTRPHVSSSESSRSSAPTCVVNGDATACGTSSAGGAVLMQPVPVVVVMSPIMGPALGGDSAGRASTDTDVDRSSQHGSAITR
ncbi:MAG: hypothetical protein U0075_09635 [Thermomicrobiales bacterium]